MLGNVRFHKVSGVTVWLDALEDRHRTCRRTEIKYVSMSFQNVKRSFLSSFT